MRGNLRIAGIPVVLAVILPMVQILGCGKDPIVSSNPGNTINTRYSSIMFGSTSSAQDLISAGVDQAGSGPELSQKWLVLSNGFTVYKNRHHSTTEYLAIDFAYEDLEHNVYERRIEIASLTEIKLKNRNGQSIVEYGYELVNENTLLYHVQTQIDTLLFEIQRIDDSVQLSVSVNQNTYITGFASVAELQMAMQLCEEADNQFFQGSMGGYEQDIIQRYENLILPIMGASSLNQNKDVDAAMYLFSDPGFLH